jgi:hypothetical protein
MPVIEKEYAEHLKRASLMPEDGRHNMPEDGRPPENPYQKLENDRIRDEIVAAAAASVEVKNNPLDSPEARADAQTEITYNPDLTKDLSKKVGSEALAETVEAPVIEKTPLDLSPHETATSILLNSTSPNQPEFTQPKVETPIPAAPATTVETQTPVTG